MSEHSYFVVLNTASGAALAAGLTKQTLAAHLAERGLTAEIVSPDEDGGFAETTARARASKADVLVAAGGDGTVTALAEVALETDKLLAILPLGTANLLARDLSIPLDIEGWLDALADMQPHMIDVATVNGRVFLHKVVLGLLPGIVSAREHLRTRIGRIPLFSFITFVLRRVDRLRQFRVGIDIDGGGVRRQSVAAVAVANNAYAEGIGRFFAREKLDAGKLTVYVARRITLFDVFRVLGGMVIGNWYRADAFFSYPAEEVTLSRHRNRAKVMLDGDVETLEYPLRFAIRPGALGVLAPPGAAMIETDTIAEPVPAG